MNNMEIHNCKTCLYSNLMDGVDHDVVCDKKVLLTGQIFVVPKENVDLPCPAHSDRFIEEWRYMRNNKDIRDADDACEVCGRLMDMKNTDNYDYVEIEIETEEGIDLVEIVKCKICIEKER